MTWKPVELVEDYWIIIDNKTYDEYVNKAGDNLMFETKKEAQDKIDTIHKECGK